MNNTTEIQNQPPEKPKQRKAWELDFLEGFNFFHKDLGPQQKKTQNKSPIIMSDGAKAYLQAKKDKNDFLEGFYDEYRSEAEEKTRELQKRQEESQAKVQKQTAQLAPKTATLQTQEKSGGHKVNTARARATYAARPEVRNKLIAANKKQLEEKGRQAIYEREFARLSSMGDEKAAQKALQIADNDKNAKELEKHIKNRIRELEFAKDIELAGKVQAQAEFERATAEALANGEDNPAVYALQKGDEVLEEYKNLAGKARNDLFKYESDEKIAGYEQVKNLPDFSSGLEQGRFVPVNDEPFSFKNPLGKKIVSFINDENLANAYSVDPDERALARKASELTEDERDVMRYYASKGDYDSIEGYYDELGRSLNERVQKEVNQKTRDYAYDHPWMASVGNVISSFGTPLAYFANAGQAIKNSVSGEYEPTDTNSSLYSPGHYVESSADGITDRVYDAAGGGTIGELASEATGAALSVAGKLAKAPLGKFAIPFIAFDDAGQSTLDSLKRGADPNETLAASTAKGAVSAATYKMPFGDLASGILDGIMFGENSEYNKSLLEFQKAGIPEEEAKKRAFAKELRERLFEDGFGYILEKSTDWMR